MMLCVCSVIHARHITSKCVKSHWDSVSLTFLPQLDIICDLFSEQMHSNMESSCITYSTCNKETNKEIAYEVVYASVL